MNSDMLVVQKMLGALMRHQGLLQWVDCLAFGRNDGGLYVSLFNSKAAYRVGTVYSEQFYKLPDYIQALIPDDAGEISTEKARVEKRGLLVEVPGFMITRYKMNADDEQDKWRFGDVLYVAKNAATTAPQPEQKPQAEAQPEPEAAESAVDNPWRVSVAEPLAFTGPADAIRWGVDTGVFTNYEASKTAYERVKRIQMPGSAGEMWILWVKHVQELAAKAEQARAIALAEGAADALTPIDPGVWGRLWQPPAVDSFRTVFLSYTEFLTLPSYFL